jgi:hypothetical protein
VTSSAFPHFATSVRALADTLTFRVIRVDIQA